MATGLINNFQNKPRSNSYDYKVVGEANLLKNLKGIYSIEFYDSENKLVWRDSISLSAKSEYIVSSRYWGGLYPLLVINKGDLTKSVKNLSSYLVNQPGFSNKYFYSLFNGRVLDRRYEPYDAYINLGYFENEKVEITHLGEDIIIKFTSLRGESFNSKIVLSN